MKKLLALSLALIMLFAFAGCGKEKPKAQNGKVLSIHEVELTKPSTVKATNLSDVKVGFIFLHDKTSTYDLNFIDAATAACKKLGLKDDQIILKTNIPEDGDDCYNTAKELVSKGCNLVFADSFGHEPNMIKAAKEFPEVQFCHATGTRAVTELVPNYHNAFADIYQGRYLAGIAAGMKLNELIEAGKFDKADAKMGYVGAFPYAEVISGYTSFYLGAKSVCPTVTMDVEYTNSWFDPTAEKAAATALIKNGCKLISQHADSSGAPTACEEAGIPNVSYNVDTRDLGPTTAIISSKINWQPYFEKIIGVIINGGIIESDYCATLEEGAVQLTEPTENAAAGTAEAIEAAKEKLISGEIKVFDTSTFTYKGKQLTSSLADVVDLGDYVADTEAVSDGYYHESEYRSAPYFSLIIDGITVLESE